MAVSRADAEASFRHLVLDAQRGLRRPRGVRHLIGMSGDRESSAQLSDRALDAEISRKAQEYGRVHPGPHLGRPPGSE
jgi:hypothetical protein